MLEKVVLICTAYFCIATEMRYLLEKTQSPDETAKNVSLGHCEAFHAKATHIALTFLPLGCPLADYIQNSYVSTYLAPNEQKTGKSN